MLTSDTVSGVIIGIFMGMKEGQPLVVFAGNPEPEAIPARSLVTLPTSAIGCEVALLFEDDARDKPLIIGRVLAPAPNTDSTNVIRDGETVKVTADERIELRVGKSSIIMEKDGHITIRGTYLVNHASASNRIRGGSINLN
ncbi:MAG: DUF6484 domain-containing protein [Pseudomonadota bacterium]